MDLAPRPSQAPSGPRDALEEAIKDFQSILSKDEQKMLRDIKQVPAGQAVMQFTAELDLRRQSMKGRSVASRFHSVLQSVRDFSTIVDTSIPSRLEIAALVWGSVQVTILVIVNFASYFEPFSHIFMKFKEHCPRFIEYQALYPTSTRLQGALCNFHASIIRCCKHAVQILQRSKTRQFLQAVRQSLDQELKPEIDDVLQCGNEVQEEVTLAKAQADSRHHELQRQEQEASSKARQILTRFVPKSEADIADRKQWQLQQELRYSLEQRSKLLEKLSSHDYHSPFKEACKMRHPGTAEWFFSTNEFKRWRNSAAFSLLWCSGKIGSGKTILTTSAINHVFSENFHAADSCVTFFFIRFDHPQSLKTETILRSILRQSLDVQSLSKEMETALVDLDSELCPSLDDWIALLRQRIAQSNRFYIFIDGVDECDPAERGDLLDKLSILGTYPLGLRVFLTSRESLPRELQEKLSSVELLSMTSPAAGSDINLFVKEELEKRRSRKDLVVGAESLVADIQAALTQHADGMFLWVRYLIEELCAQHSDDDIRRCLSNLPKDLEELFNRTLSRIVSRKNDKIIQRIFPWIAAAKRNLTLEELRDALSTDVHQPHSMPEKRVNGIERITAWCENLLQVDEELTTVQFAHRSIYDFITSAQSRPRPSSFYVDIQSADHYCGEICMTYLYFNDFQTTLARRPQPMHGVIPAKIAHTALGRYGQKLESSLHLLGLTSSHRKPHIELDVTGVLASYKRADVDKALVQLHQSHPFLKYAAEYWILHTGRFSVDISKTWTSWRQVILDGHALAQKPWPDHGFRLNLSEILSWSCKMRHKALLRLINVSGELTISRKCRVMERLASEGDLELLSVFLEKQVSHAEIRPSFRAASKGGHLQVVERLLAAGARVNAEPAGYDGQTALQAASEGGHLQVINRLLAAGESVNAEPAYSGGRTALQAASEGGHLEVVDRLLAAGESVNAEPAYSGGRTALQAASEGGHLEVVDRLLAAGASVNAEPAEYGGRTALQAASGGGHLEVIDRLLAAGASINAEPAVDGRTALQAACEGGHLEVVDRLLAAGESVNAEPAYSGGRTALQAASEGGHLEVVDRLLAAGASVNAEPAEYGGRTALQAASGGGHLEVVERLLVAGARVNAEPAKYGRTALQAASGGGHLEVVERLLAAGASVNAEPAEYGRTTLQAASGGGHLEVVDRLLAAGARVNAEPAKHGRTALQAASERGHLEVVDRLLAAGARVNAERAKDGQTALQAASGGGHLEVVDRLLAAGASVNAEPAKHGRTALQAASGGGHLDIVERLLIAEANVNAEPAKHSGRTALQAASGGGHLEVVDRLLAAGARVNAEPAEYGQTALQAASERGHLEVVELLLAAGARVNAERAKDGQTALQAASGGGHLEVVERLRRAGAVERRAMVVE